MRFRPLHVLWILILALVSGAPVFSSNPITIVSVAPGNPGSPAISSSQFLMETWTSTVAFTNVSIGAYVFSGNAANTAATAYLVTQVGAGSSYSTLVSEASLTLPVGDVGTTPELNLFTGLTLPPGQYYLIVATTDSSSNEAWLNGNLPNVVTAPGVTLNGSGHTAHSVDPVYPPASNFSGTYSVGFAFDVAGVPLDEDGVVGMVIPQVVDGNGWQSTIVAMNTSKVLAHAALQFFQTIDGDGDTAPWTLPTVEHVNLSDITLGPGAMVLVHSANTATTLTQGYGELVASPGVQAFAIFTLHVHGRQDQDGTAPAAYPGSDIIVPFDNSPGFTTGIAVVNASDAAEVLNANIVLASGDTIASSLPSIPAHGHAAFSLATQFPELAGQVGTLELSVPSGPPDVTTSQPLPAGSPAVPAAARPGIAVSMPRFSVIGLRFNPTGAFSSIPVYSAYFTIF